MVFLGIKTWNRRNTNSPLFCLKYFFNYIGMLCKGSFETTSLVRCFYGYINKINMACEKTPALGGKRRRLFNLPYALIGQHRQVNSLISEHLINPECWRYCSIYSSRFLSVASMINKHFLPCNVHQHTQKKKTPNLCRNIGLAVLRRMEEPLRPR